MPKRISGILRAVIEHATLPNLDTLDFTALKALILTQHQQLLSKNEQLACRDSEIEHLKLLIAKLRRQQFGRKSEKVERQIEQLELRLGELEASRTEREIRQNAVSAKPDVARPVRRALPTHLPREERRVLPAENKCPDCGGELKHLGEDVSEILERVPEHFRVIRQVRPKLACCGCDKIVQAEAPSRPIARRGICLLPRCGLLTRRTARESIRKDTWLRSAGPCRRMPIRATTECMRTAGFAMPDAWPMCGASSTICWKHTNRL